MKPETATKLVKILEVTSINKKSLVIATMITAILTVSIVASLLAVNTVGSSGLYVRLKLYEVDVVNRRVIDVTEVLEKQNVSMYVEVNAIAPPQFREDVVTLHRSYSKAFREFFIPLKNWTSVAEGWVSTIKSRGGDVKNTYSGLILRILIVNETSRATLFQLYDSISYIPHEIASGKSLNVVLYISKNSARVAYMETTYTSSSLGVGVHVVEASENDLRPYTIIRYPVLKIEPENLTSRLPSSYFRSVDGKLYVKTPVMIVYNERREDGTSGTVGVSINIGTQTVRVGVYPTYTLREDILDRISNGIVPSVTLWKGSGFTWGGNSYYFTYNYYVFPNTAQWVWIWARPVYRVYKIYNCGPFNCVPWYDEVEAVITDVLTEGSTILGGRENGLPHQSLMNMLFNGSVLKHLSIPGTLLSDGDLDPGEYVALEQILNYYDTCNSDFEIGMPVGAIAALACSALGTSAAGAACAAFTSGFEISLSMEGDSIMVTGGLVNHSDVPDVPGDYDVPELVYIALSKFRYKVDPPWWCWRCSPCYYNVTAGIYFRCK